MIKFKQSVLPTSHPTPHPPFLRPLRLVGDAGRCRLIARAFFPFVAFLAPTVVAILELIVPKSISALIGVPLLVLMPRILISVPISTLSAAEEDT